FRQSCWQGRACRRSFPFYSQIWSIFRVSRPSGAATLPVNRGDEREAGHVANDRPADGGNDDQGDERGRHGGFICAAAEHHPGDESRDSDEKEDVVDDCGREVCVQQVVSHPQTAAGGAVPAGQQFERALRKDRTADMRVDEAGVGRRAGDGGSGRERGESLPSASGSRDTHAFSMPPDGGPGQVRAQTASNFATWSLNNLTRARLSCSSGAPNPKPFGASSPCV